MHAGKPERRLEREKWSVECMIEIHCRDVHRTHGEICTDCRDLLNYSLGRLDKCKLLPDKPTCARCLVHCFNPEMRHRIQAVMRHAGPRMIFRHPVLSLLHVLDGLDGRCRE